MQRWLLPLFCALSALGPGKHLGRIRGATRVAGELRRSGGTAVVVAVLLGSCGNVAGDVQDIESLAMAGRPPRKKSKPARERGRVQMQADQKTYRNMGQGDKDSRIEELGAKVKMLQNQLAMSKSVMEQIMETQETLYNIAQENRKNLVSQPSGGQHEVVVKMPDMPQQEQSTLENDRAAQQGVQVLKFRRNSYWERKKKKEEFQARFKHLHSHEAQLAQFKVVYKMLAKKDPTPEMLRGVTAKMPSRLRASREAEEDYTKYGKSSIKFASGIHNELMAVADDVERMDSDQLEEHIEKTGMLDSSSISEGEFFDENKGLSETGRKLKAMMSKFGGDREMIEKAQHGLAVRVAADHNTTLCESSGKWDWSEMARQDEFSMSRYVPYDPQYKEMLKEEEREKLGLQPQPRGRSEEEPDLHFGDERRSRWSPS